MTRNTPRIFARNSVGIELTLPLEQENSAALADRLKYSCVRLWCGNKLECLCEVNNRIRRVVQETYL